MRPLFALLFLFFLVSRFAFTEASAQRTGVITGRVVTEDGDGAPNVGVELYPVSDQPSLGRAISTVTGDDGSFKFTGLSPRAYTIGARAPNGYISRPRSAWERNNHGYYRIGDNVVITLIRGGVITGRVTTAEGEPIVGARIVATMTRDAEGHPVQRIYGARQRWTDDRGVYRMYGLAPGTYVVAAHNNIYVPQLMRYVEGAPTFHLSSTFDAATEVTVTNGGESSGVDIRYRGESGHAISGMVIAGDGISESYRGASVMLYSVAAEYSLGSAYVQPGSNGFAFYGVNDGEYEIVARSWYDREEGYASAPRRVTVRGADAGGVELKLEPQSSISGKVIVEKSAKVCEAGRDLSIEEMVVSLRRDEKATERRIVNPGSGVGGALTGKGEFKIHHVDSGRYFIAPRLPVDNWYVKSITAPATNAKSPASVDIARHGVTLNAGAKLSGVTVAISNGAASLNGKVIAAKEGTRLPLRVRVHLAPAESTGADDVLRYAETIARPDGSFRLNNIAPGKYWLIARAVSDDEPVDRPAPPIAWDANERAKLRKEAEALKTEVDLKPCQRAPELTVKFAR